MNTSWQVPNYQRINFKQKKSKYVVIVPVINEGVRIQDQLKKMSLLAQEIDIFIVDGGSQDQSVLPQLLAKRHIRALLVKQGLGGLGAQLRIGMAQAIQDGYRGVILIDGNNKDNPQAIPLFISKLDQGYDYVQGSRFLPGGKALNTPFLRWWGIKTLHAPLLSAAAKFKFTDTTNGFRAYSKSFLTDPQVSPFRKIFSQYEIHYYLAIKAARLKKKVCEIPVERNYPPGKIIPSKIKGFRGNFKILLTLLKACLGAFDPGRPQ